MKVDLITETNSDLTVVNAARCSFDKESTWYYEGEERNESLCKADVKLIKYLANNNHWTPFGHPQEVFELHIDWSEYLNFFHKANLSGFEWGDFWNLHSSDTPNAFLKVRGSLYAWLTNACYLPKDVEWTIYHYLLEFYPISTASLWISKAEPNIPFSRITSNIPIEKRSEDELKTYTLRIRCPIFVKRQLETHRRNFVMTDIEDFCQNEVSRRYVDTEPEFYLPSKWRIQHKSKKQGSDETQELEQMTNHLTTLNYTQHVRNALIYYNKMNDNNIAHEQSRMILPLSTYTTFWWTGSLKSWKRVFGLRLDSHAQSETRELVQMIKDAIDEDRRPL